MVYINVENGKAAARAANPDLPDNPAHLSPRELVEKAEYMLINGGANSGGGEEMWLGGKIKEGEYLTTQGRKAGEYQYKLIDQARFVFWGDFVINTDDEKHPRLEPHFLTARDVCFTDKEYRVIGYVPQRVLKAAWAEVRQAFDAKDFERVYRLFQDSYQAYPCTDEEWHRLKAEGKN